MSSTASAHCVTNRARDDAAPWNRTLRPELFARDLDWSELLAELRTVGPDG